jgi:Tol biopolymer transport system component
MITRAVVAVAAGVLTAVGIAPTAHAAENGALVFEASDPGSQTEQVYRVGPGGGALTQVTQAQFEGDWNECPSWSPSGKRVWYDNADRAQNTAPQVYRVPATGGQPTKV